MQKPRRPRLFVEQLEQRMLLAGDMGNMDSPPESYRSPRISDGLAELAYEYDQWLSARDFQPFIPSDSRILLDGHQVYVVALTTGSGAMLADQLRGVGGDVVSTGDTERFGVGAAWRY